MFPTSSPQDQHTFELVQRLRDVVMPEAVRGSSAVARVTAAAAVMVCVFISFVLIDQREVKMFGFGLSVAVLIEATIVRLVLVPATMELLGRANWWLPSWLGRVLPVVHIDGERRDGGRSHDIARVA